MTEKLTLEKIKKHYWACHAIMTSAGGKMPEGHVCTMIKDDCKICGAKDQIMAPWVDYGWPDRRTDMIAKANRD